MAFTIAQDSELFLSTEPLRPAIRGYNRLEGRPRAEEFQRALRAEVRDALWFLTRQWQFGELKGDDAGSPIDARIAITRTQLASYAPKDDPAVDFPTALPLEAVVEREPVPADLTTHRQIARGAERALARAGIDPAVRPGVLDGLRTAYPLDPATLDGALDTATRRDLVMAEQRLFDGVAFLAEVAAGEFDTRVDADFALDAATASAVKASARRTVEWFDSLYTQPGALGRAWAPEQLEYRFSCETAVAGGANEALTASGYAQGHLDWSAFDFADGTGAGGHVSRSMREALSFVPTAVTFGGMPNPRYWELEDRKVEFADVTAGTTDVAKLLLTEFALVYSNDWCLIPIEVEVGALCAIEGLVVTDVFGERSLVRPAGRGAEADWQRWAMFTLSSPAQRADPRLFIPPATPKLLEPAPVERVAFVRDEMANMAWAVERVVPSATGGGTDGNAYAGQIAGPPPVEPPLAEGAEVRYRLGVDPPWNWQPFIPVHLPEENRSVRLQRARLPEGARPIVGAIIDEPAPFYINEEEVPRSGRVTTRGFQRCRWTNGRCVLWLGRRTRTGRGESASGLVFDDIAADKS